MPIRRPLVLLSLLFLPALASGQAEPKRTVVTAEVATSTPMRGEWTPAVLQRLKVPQGFRLDVFATNLGAPRVLAVSPGGRLYLTRRDSGDVLMLPVSRDGKAGTPKKVVADLPGLHGIAFDTKSDAVFLATTQEVYRGTVGKDGTITGLKAIITELPEGGQHGNRTIGIGPDRMLYISVGSSCNQCNETNPEHATMLRARMDGSERGTFARGLRNTVGWAWVPGMPTLWGVDHGSDFAGNEIPMEELNLIGRGSNYGWPFCHGDRLVMKNYSRNPEGTTKEAMCPGTIPPALTFDAHSAPMQLLFYPGPQFPDEFRNDAFVTLRGSWNREPPVGYKVVRVRFREGRPVSSEDFLTGFLDPDGHRYWGRPMGLALLPDGSLLVGDDTNGVIYRISYQAGAPRQED